MLKLLIVSYHWGKVGNSITRLTTDIMNNFIALGRDCRNTEKAAHLRCSYTELTVTGTMENIPKHMYPNCKPGKLQYKQE